MRNSLKLTIFLSFLVLAQSSLIDTSSGLPPIAIAIIDPEPGTVQGTTSSQSQKIFREEGYWGDWTDYIQIENYFICGAEMRFEDPIGKGNKKDDTATNGFRWKFCNYPNWYDQQQREYEGLWGEWKGMRMCPAGYYVNGFQARIEPKQYTHDDTAMNGLELLCILPNSGTTPASQIITVFEGVWGTWRGWKTADFDLLFYGVKMRFESNQKGGDDTAMNGLQFEAKEF